MESTSPSFPNDSYSQPSLWPECYACGTDDMTKLYSPIGLLNGCECPVCWTDDAQLCSDCWD